MPTELPPEIVKQIIDNVADGDSDSRAALPACALISRAWLEPSRAHIYRTMEIELQENEDELGLVALFGSPAMACHVRELTVGQQDVATDTKAWFALAEPVFAQLENVLRFNLFRLDWQALQFNERHVFMSQYTSVTRLSLYDVVFGTVDDVLDFIAAFPSLYRLRLADVWWREKTSSPSRRRTGEALKISPSLKVLQFGECSAACKLANWLSSQAECFALKSLELGWAMGEGQETLSRMFNVLGGDLEYLDVDIFRGVGDDVTASVESRDPDTEVFWNPPSIQHLTKLRTLVFGNLALGALPVNSSTGSNPDFAWVPHLLSTSAAPQLRTVEFCIYLEQHWQASQMPWVAIDEILSGPRFAALEEVVIKPVSGESWRGDGDLIQFIEEELAGLHSRGILRFEKNYSCRSSWRERQAVWEEPDSSDCSDDSFASLSMLEEDDWMRYSTSDQDWKGPRLEWLQEQLSRAAPRDAQLFFSDLRELTDSPEPIGHDDVRDASSQLVDSVEESARNL